MRGKQVALPESAIACSSDPGVAWVIDQLSGAGASSLSASAECVKGALKSAALPARAIPSPTFVGGVNQLPAEFGSARRFGRMPISVQ